MLRVWLVLVPLTACGEDPDPCATVSGACITLRVDSTTVDAIDLLELDLLYGDTHDTIATALDTNGAVALPVVTSIALDLAAPTEVGVVAAGKLSGGVLGIGAASTTLAANQRVELELVLAPRSTCVTGGDYCGGDEIAGDEATLYRCTDGVPLARGRCEHGCTVRDGIDDGCAGGPMTCITGGFYCGGNELVGDPVSVYRCQDGQGVERVMCPNGCVIAPPGTDDFCR